MFLLAFDVARSKTQDCLSPGKKQHHSRPALDPPFLTKDLLGPDFYPYKTRRRQFRQKNDAQPSGVTYTFSEGTFFFWTRYPRMYNLESEEREFHESGKMYWNNSEEKKHIHQRNFGSAK